MHELVTFPIELSSFLLLCFALSYEQTSPASAPTTYVRWSVLCAQEGGKHSLNPKK
jgi:hypothetical protein